MARRRKGRTGPPRGPLFRPPTLDHLDALRAVGGKAVVLDGWVRIVDYASSDRPLSSRGSLSLDGGRFNVGQRLNPDRYPAQFDLPANSQEFGRLLRKSGYEGVVYRSTKGSGRCLALFDESRHGLIISHDPLNSAPCGQLP